jgi:hypothetical protein
MISLHLYSPKLAALNRFVRRLKIYANGSVGSLPFFYHGNGQNADWNTAKITLNRTGRVDYTL